MSGPATAAEPMKETFTGTLIQVGGSLSGKSAPVTIQITGVTNDDEAAGYRKALQTQGQDGLQKAVSKQDLGFVALSGQTGTRINAVRMKQTPQGTQYVLLLERMIGIAEARNSGRSMDYPFALIKMTIKADGKGDGKAVGMAKIKMKKDNTIEVENFGTYPANLVGLQKR
jgi:hypothetical protein